MSHAQHHADESAVAAIERRIESVREEVGEALDLVRHLHPRQQIERVADSTRRGSTQAIRGARRRSKKAARNVGRVASRRATGVARRARSGASAGASVARSRKGQTGLGLVVLASIALIAWRRIAS